MKVRAIKEGYLGQYRHIGDEFEILNEKAFSDVWMEVVEEKEVPKPAKPVKGAFKAKTDDDDVI